jgi:hypothetical protein
MSINQSENHDLIPLEFHLGQNYPDPFMRTTKIKYCVAYKTRVRISIYNHEDEMIDMLVDEIKQAGTYEVEFSASYSQSHQQRKIADGYYYYMMEAGDYSSEKKWLCIDNKSENKDKPELFSKGNSENRK